MIITDVNHNIFLKKKHLITLFCVIFIYDVHSSMFLSIL